MSFKQIRYEVSDRVATITLDRPERRNCFTWGMADELIAAYDRADADGEVGAIVLTGEGPTFCAGWDLNSDEEGPEPPADGPRPDPGGRVSLRVFELKKPIIAAINGSAAGVGITMTLPMDIRVMSAEAKVGFVFVRRGLVPEACSSWFLPRVVGISQAMEWVASGRVFPAEEALSAGLVRSLHGPDEVLPAAHALAQEFANEGAPVSVALARRLLWQGMLTEHPREAHLAETRALAARSAGADMAEGVASFLEKREVSWPERVGAELPPIFED